MLRRRIRRGARHAGGEEGTAVVEFAFIGIIFLGIVIMLAQGAVIFQNWLVITNAVREGARAGVPCYGRLVQGCNASDVSTATINAAQGIDQSGLTVHV